VIAGVRRNHYDPGLPAAGVSVTPVPIRFDCQIKKHDVIWCTVSGLVESLISSRRKLGLVPIGYGRVPDAAFVRRPEEFSQ
jgi:hypothetical protein